MGVQPQYWKIRPAEQPGDVVAEHDGYQGETPGSGPGNYRVAVRRPSRPFGWPITLQTSEGVDLCSFNRGMARWFGLRLIEAAELDELREQDLASMQASSRWGEVQEWMHNNAADYLAEVRPGDSVIPAVLRLMGDAKQILATTGGETVAIDPEARGKDRADLIEQLNDGLKRDLISEELRSKVIELFDVEGDSAAVLLYSLGVVQTSIHRNNVAYFLGIVRQQRERQRPVAAGVFQ